MYIANLDNPKCSSHKPAATASQWPAIRSTDCNEALRQRRLYICITLWVPERSIWHSKSKVPLGLSASLISKVKISKLHSDVPTLSKTHEQWLVRSGVKRRFCHGLLERQTCVEISPFVIRHRISLKKKDLSNTVINYRRTDKTCYNSVFSFLFSVVMLNYGNCRH